MVNIVFETHSTSTDNEAGLASGWNDPNLSEKGKEQARELGDRRKNDKFAAVFCADMERTYQTASIAFGNDPRLIYCDWRLRECDYGTFNGKPEELVNSEKPKRIDKPFPGGESYEDCIKRMRSFLEDLKDRFDGHSVLIIGTLVPYYALEHLTKSRDLKQVITEPRPWQPGWEYELE